MKITKRQWRIALFLSLITYSSGVTLACFAWMEEDMKNKEMNMQNSIEILVAEQEIEFLKNALLSAPSKEPILLITADTMISALTTPYEKLNNFITSEVPGLSKYVSTMKFQLLADKYGIDAGFALATFILETGWGKSDAWLKKNNPAGLTCGSSYCSFKSKDKGTEEMFKLMQLYASGSITWVGIRKTVDEVRSKWSTTEDTAVIVNIWNRILVE